MAILSYVLKEFTESDRVKMRIDFLVKLIMQLAVLRAFEKRMFDLTKGGNRLRLFRSQLLRMPTTHMDKA